MIYISNTLDFSVDRASAITFGKFDGLHKGHEHLIDRMMSVCREEGLASIAFSFDIPPKTRVEGDDWKVLTTNDEKRHILERTGVDYMIECPFTTEVRCMEAEDFIRWITLCLKVKAIVVGTDFRFGHNRCGDYHVLQSFEEKYGYKTIVIEKIQDRARDISSTYIREVLSAGDIPLVNHLLGYQYFLSSRVIHGRQLGRTIGIPTINMSFPPEKLLPPNGVYVTRVLVEDEWYMGVTNVGCKPTVGKDNPVGVETYIIDFCQNLYDKVITVEFEQRLREERRFESIEALKLQMSEDIAAAVRYFHSESAESNI